MSRKKKSEEQKQRERSVLFLATRGFRTRGEHMVECIYCPYTTRREYLMAQMNHHRSHKPTETQIKKLRISP